jgi:uncharacterized membrane protein HdeD (DUF308 family)
LPWLIQIKMAAKGSVYSSQITAAPVLRSGFIRALGAPMRGAAMNVNRLPDTRSIHDYWEVFVGEGGALVALGLLAIIIPSIGGGSVTLFLSWLFLISGAIGLLTTYWARHLPGFWWSLVSALLAIIVGVVLIANRAQDLYGGLMGWPFATVGPLRMILVFFFLIEGAASIMFASEHRHAGRWAGMLASGILDILLACVIIFDLPGSSAWSMGLLIGINMIAGGVSLIAMGLHAHSGPAASDPGLQRRAQ